MTGICIICENEREGEKVRSDFFCTQCVEMVAPKQDCAGSCGTIVRTKYCKPCITRLENISISREKKGQCQDCGEAGTTKNKVFWCVGCDLKREQQRQADWDALDPKFKPYVTRPSN